MVRRVIITPWFDTRATGGGARFSVEAAQFWLLRGDEVHILSSDSRRTITGFEPFLSSGRLQIHQVSKADRMHLAQAFDPEVYQAAKSVLAEFEPESIHIHNFHGLIGAVCAAVDSDAPTIYLAHDFGLLCMSWCLYDGTLTPCSGPEPSKCRACLRRNFPLSLGARLAKHLPGWLVRLVRPGVDVRHYQRLEETRRFYEDVELHLGQTMGLLKRFDAIVATSPLMARVLIQHGAPPDRVKTLACGVSRRKQIGRARAPRASQAPLRLAFLGYASDVKGLPVVAKALAGLPPDLQLSVTAYGGGCEWFVKRAPRSVRRYLRAGPLLIDGQVGEELARTDGVLVPSLWHENAPAVVLEALASGVPVIASRQAGITHLIAHEENGFLVPPGDVEGWRAVLHRLAQDPEILRRMSPNCRYERTDEDFCRDLEGVVASVHNWWARAEACSKSAEALVVNSPNRRITRPSRRNSSNGKG